MADKDKPEDYAQPKHRAATEALRAVERAVDEARTIEQSSTEKVTDYALLGAQAILKYADASAMQIEQVGNEVLAEGERIRDECRTLAEDIRHAGRLQAAAVERAMSRNKTAAIGVTDLRRAFHDDVAKERSELEAVKQRASG